VLRYGICLNASSCDETPKVRCLMDCGKHTFSVQVSWSFFEIDV